MYGAHPSLHTQTRTNLDFNHATSANKTSLWKIALVERNLRGNQEGIQLATRTTRTDNSSDPIGYEDCKDMSHQGHQGHST